MHPDKCPGPTAVDDFQKITTSYHVILDLDKRSCYMRLFLLRCYMSQVRPEENGPLRPFYAFMIEKQGSMGSKSVCGRHYQRMRVDLRASLHVDNLLRSASTSTLGEILGMPPIAACS